LYTETQLTVASSEVARPRRFKKFCHLKDGHRWHDVSQYNEASGIFNEKF